MKIIKIFSLSFFLCITLFLTVFFASFGVIESSNPLRGTLFALRYGVNKGLIENQISSLCYKHESFSDLDKEFTKIGAYNRRSCGSGKERDVYYDFPVPWKYKEKTWHNSAGEPLVIVSYNSNGNLSACFVSKKIVALTTYFGE